MKGFERLKARLSAMWIFFLLALAYAEECDDEGLSLRQLRGLKTEASIGGHWSLSKPDPQLLVWDNVLLVEANSTNGSYNATVYNGWLKVPLVHDKALLDYELPPSVCLRVRAVAALQQPARLGPLLAHCGGPSSGRDCAQMMSDMNFDIDGRHSAFWQLFNCSGPL